VCGLPSAAQLMIRCMYRVEETVRTLGCHFDEVLDQATSSASSSTDTGDSMGRRA
jgi:hypothetical protein